MNSFPLEISGMETRSVFGKQGSSEKKKLIINLGKKKQKHTREPSNRSHERAEFLFQKVSCSPHLGSICCQVFIYQACSLP